MSPSKLLSVQQKSNLIARSTCAGGILFVCLTGIRPTELCSREIVPSYCSKLTEEAQQNTTLSGGIFILQLGSAINFVKICLNLVSPRRVSCYVSSA